MENTQFRNVIVCIYYNDPLVHTILQVVSTVAQKSLIITLSLG